MGSGEDLPQPRVGHAGALGKFRLADPPNLYFSPQPHPCSLGDNRYALISSCVI